MAFYFFLLNFIVLCLKVEATHDVFTDDEVEGCGKIRIPKIVSTPSQVIVWGQCRNYGSSIYEEKLATKDDFVGDDFSTNQIVSKISTDNGTTWSEFTKNKNIGFSNPTPIYDDERKQVVLLYQYYPDEDPSYKVETFAQISKDDGKTFGDPINITDQVIACSPKAPNHMMQFSAGSRAQTSSGRLIVTGHNDKGMGCIFYSDDGGSTWSANYMNQKTKEISAAEVNPGNLLLNGRDPEGRLGERNNYRSKDDGDTWGDPEVSELETHSCEGAILARPLEGSTKSTIFYSGVDDNDRNGLTLRCSLDGGHSWPYSSNKYSGKAGYSDMALLPDGDIIAVFEAQGGHAGAKSTHTDGSFCKE